MNYLVKFIFFFVLINLSTVNAKENIMILKLKTGDVKIELYPDVAPNHVNRIKELANEGKYDNVVFHRVIDGFMAQTGDVKFGNSSDNNFNLLTGDLEPRPLRYCPLGVTFSVDGDRV